MTSVAIRFSSVRLNPPAFCSTTAFGQVGKHTRLWFCEYLLDFGLEDRQIVLCREPHFVDVYPEVAVDEFVAHAGNILPLHMHVLAPQLI